MFILSKHMFREYQTYANGNINICQQSYKHMPTLAYVSIIHQDIESTGKSQKHNVPLGFSLFHSRIHPLTLYHTHTHTHTRARSRTHAHTRVYPQTHAPHSRLQGKVLPWGWPSSCMSCVWYDESRYLVRGPPLLDLPHSWWWWLLLLSLLEK